MNPMTKKLLTLLAILLIAAPGAALAQEDANRSDDDLEDQDENASEENETEGQEAQDDAENETEEDDEDERDEREEREERKVEVTANDQRAEFKLEKETDASEQEVKLVFEATEGDLKLEFESEANGTERSLEYKVKLERLVEYQDVNGDGLWAEGTEPAYASYDVQDLDWEIAPVGDVTVDGRTGKAVEATGTIPDTNGTFTVRMVAFGDYVSVNATDLKPTDVKIDFVYTNIPWTTSTSRLALDLKVETEQEVEHEDENASAPGLNATFGDVSAYFTWADTALVDGNSTPVKSQVTESESETESEDGESESKTEKRLLLNYQQGEEIVHDPVMGVAYSSQSAGEVANTPFPGAAVLLALVGTVALLRGRRN